MKSSIVQLRARSVLYAPPGKPFILKSGAESMTYIDVRLTALTSEGLWVLSDALIRAMKRMGSPPRHVAGVAVGGCPLATGVSMITGIDALYVRPEAKDHGTGKLVEGPFKPDDTVVLVEDVITTGGSTLKAVEALRDAGLRVTGIVAVLDRQQGGRQMLSEKAPGIPIASLATLEELLA